MQNYIHVCDSVILLNSQIVTLLATGKFITKFKKKYMW